MVAKMESMLSQRMQSHTPHKQTKKARKRVPPETGIIGGNLRHLRRRSGLSQSELGHILDVSFQQVQKYENGQNRLPIEKLYILKHIYGVPYEMFFTGMEEFLIKKL
jgi:DNA-binding transcriptional regulator YiaG